MSTRSFAIVLMFTLAGSLSGQSTIPISNVTDLSNELAMRPMKGATFSPSRAAIVNSAGQVEAVSGNLSDCVHVDGTSGACGVGTGTANFVDGEQPSGVIDGVNATLTLSAAPSPALSLQLFRNGILLKVGADYTLTLPNSVKFVAEAIPQPGDLIQAFYRTDSSARSLGRGGSTTDMTSRVADEVGRLAIALASDERLPFLHATVTQTPMPSTPATTDSKSAHVPDSVANLARRLVPCTPIEAAMKATTCDAPVSAQPRRFPASAADASGPDSTTPEAVQRLWQRMTSGTHDAETRQETESPSSPLKKFIPIWRRSPER